VPKHVRCVKQNARRVAVSCVVSLLSLTSIIGARQNAIEWRTVAPGVEHAHITREGPLNINLLRVDLAQARLDVVHARDEAVGLEPLSVIAARAGAIAAVNGGYFRMTGTFAGDSTGTLQIDGTLLSEPDRGRAAVGVVRTPSGSRLVMGHVTWRGTISAGGDTHQLHGINRARGRDEIVLFTPGFHASTLTDDSGTEVVVRDGIVEDVREKAGSTPIPANGFVISARGKAQEWVRARLTKGAKVSVTTTLLPVDRDEPNPWPDAEDILAAGPKLVTRGKPDITDVREKIRPGFATELHPRTAIASLADGRALLLVVDGRQPSLSIGMNLADLAALLIELGAVEAINLDGGGSTTMIVDGAIVNRPSDVTGERPISDAIVVLPKRNKP
jgi:exopolysaccharide biosynthesis protein